MQAQDLRITNLVLFIKENKISQIGHHNLGIILSNPSQNGIEPIKLTDELVSKFNLN